MLAIYRKYRPKTFEELLGQEHIVEVLKNAAAQNKFAHAYLFYGPKGSGKTTAARLIAKLANCENRQKDEKFRAKGEPCNKCSACQQIDSGQALDVIEIDAASNRGIDEIRDLKEGVKISPTSFQYKIFIIDETHMLTREAFNALLKTLEEPPKQVILILATTEFEKVPATISSRTQRFHFQKISLDKIIGKLTRVAAEEKIKIAPDALELIASLGEGSFRDSESLLDQIASLDQDITIKDVEKIAGKVGRKKTSALAELIFKNDLEKSLDYLNELDREGQNLVELNKELIHYIRRVLTLKLNPGIEELYKKELTTNDIEILKNHAALINESKTMALLKSLIRAYSEMRYSPFAIVPLEIAIIENLKK
ncbi:MAG: DNA polymerase III subunit gamma/tau [Candidatus Pacebacteria bacterium]|nr:DNA polymerase III subunit gamma/tau [Candidatus Paceibacterota bacterium]